MQGRLPGYNVKIKRWRSLYKSMRIGKKELTKREKKRLQQYVQKIMPISVEHMEQIPAMQEVIREVTRMTDFGEFGKAQDLDELLRMRMETTYQKALNITRRMVQEYHEGKAISLEQLENVASIAALVPAYFREVIKAVNPLLLEKNQGNFYSSKIANAQMERWLDYLWSPKLEQDSENERWYSATIMREHFSFFREQMKQPGFQIFDSPYLCDYIQLRRAGKLLPEVAIELDELLGMGKDVTKEKSEVAKFCQMYKNKPIQDKEEWDSLVKKLAEIKMHTGRMRLDAIQLVMYQILHKDSVLSQNATVYRGLVERTLEEFAFVSLPAKVRESDHYCYFIRDNCSSRSTTLGIQVYNTTKIVLKRKAIDALLSKKDIGIIDTIFHENAHAEQDYDRSKKHSFCNMRQYMMLKEHLLRTYDTDLYSKNYWSMYNETDARKTGLEKVQKFLKQFEDFHDVIQYDSFTGEKRDDWIEKKIEAEKQWLMIGDQKKSGKEDSTMSVHEMFDRWLQRGNGDRIRQYPILSLEYESTGTRRSLSDFLTRAEKSLQSENAEEAVLIRHLLREGSFFEREPLTEVVDFLSHWQAPDNPRLEACVAVTISEQLSRKFRAMQKEIATLPKAERIKREKEVEQMGVSILHADGRAFQLGMLHQSRKDRKIKTAMEEWQTLQKSIEKRQESKIPWQHEKKLLALPEPKFLQITIQNWKERERQRRMAKQAMKERNEEDTMEKAIEDRKQKEQRKDQMRESKKAHPSDWQQEERE